MELVSAFVLFGVMAWALGAARTRSVDQVWAAAARRLGLRFAPGGLFNPRRIQGTTAGLSVTVDTASRGSGKNSPQSTRYYVGFPHSLGLGLEIRHEGIVSSISRLFGAVDIELGDPAFDGEFEVPGSDPDGVAALLTANRRREIVRRLGPHPTARVADDGVFLATKGVERDATSIVATVENMVDLALRLIGPTEDARAATAPRPPEVAAVTATNAAAEASAPETPAVSPQEVAAAASPESPAGASEAASPTAAEVCGALFGPGACSLDAAQVFGQGFKGRRVSWIGTLRWVDSEALDFGVGPASAKRAIVEVCRETSGLSGGRAVQAMLQLSVAETEGLRDKVGQLVVVEGVLASCDAFGRILYLQDGRISDEATA